MTDRSKALGKGSPWPICWGKSMPPAGNLGTEIKDKFNKYCEQYLVKKICLNCWI